MSEYKIINGNSLEVLDTLEENSIDAIITDPPYELGFMGKKWDATGIAYNVELWKKALRVLKPGGYLLAFGGSRTFHRIACAIEDGGFEIRDTIMWLYGSGFPKSMNIGLAIDKKNGVESIDTGIASPNARPNCTKDNTLFESGTVGKNFNIKKATNEWEGWGTCLKPAFEPIIMARKPFSGSLIDNVLEYGVGGLNIDACRVELQEDETVATNVSFADQKQSEGSGTRRCITEQTEQGRFPANIMHDGSEEATKGMPDSKGASSQNNFSDGHIYRGQSLQESRTTLSGFREWYNDDGSAARYFYCAKASKKDRDDGLDNFELKTKVFNGQSDKSSEEMKDVEQRFTTECKNFHPTVKPTELMQYLVRLVCPKGATILDIFNGSGSTGKAVAFENRERNMDYSYIGIELDPEYCKISEARIDYVANKYKYDILDEIKENEKKGQLSLFDFD